MAGEISLRMGRHVEKFYVTERLPVTEVPSSERPSPQSFTPHPREQLSRVAQRSMYELYLVFTYLTVTVESSRWRMWDTRLRGRIFQFRPPESQSPLFALISSALSYTLTVRDISASQLEHCF